MTNYQVLVGDCIEMMRSLPDASIHTCVTSPPYFNLRNYEIDGQIGLEDTPDAFVARLVEVFREVRRVLRDDGTLWLNLGDSYAANRSYQVPSTKGGPKHGAGQSVGGNGSKVPEGLKPKDLIGIPWMVAFALRADGWFLRQDIIWCLSGGAWVYARTQKGDMPVMVKDLVRLDPTTVKLWNGEKWTRVLGWGRSTSTEQRIEIVLRSGERIGCTGDHLWPTQRGNVRADDLQTGDVIQTCMLPEPDGAVRPGYLTDEALWFAGLYLAEGSRGGSTIQIAGHSRETERLERIRRLVAHYGGTVTCTHDGNNQSIRIYSRILWSIVETYISGKDAKSKGVCNAAWRLPTDSLRILVDGYLSGDGHYDASNGRWRLGFTRNYSLERDLRVLAARLGATLTLTPTTSTNTLTGKKHPSFKGEWRWSRSGHHNQKDRGEVLELRASRAREFWDISVEDEPHLFALASGVLTHNCKPNPMPESVKDRCTKAHEYIFMLSKSNKYYYDHNAIKNPPSEALVKQVLEGYKGKDTKDYESGNAQSASGTKSRIIAKAREKIDKQRGHWRRHAGFNDRWDSMSKQEQMMLGSNKRSVWTVAPQPFKGAHFATFPPDLIEPCILAGCPPGGTVLDPFGGSGTTAGVALKHGRNAILCELNPDYAALVPERVMKIAGTRPTHFNRDAWLTAA